MLAFFFFDFFSFYHHSGIICFHAECFTQVQTIIITVLLTFEHVSLISNVFRIKQKWHTSLLLMYLRHSVDEK
jgi:hypothetical protein